VYRIQGKRVSRDWHSVLEEAERLRVDFQLNSGKRTMREQLKLWREKGQYHPVNNPTGAAFPSPTAPHIRVGRQDHAIDVDQYAERGGEQRLQNWLRSHGISAVNNIPTEPWHLEADDGDLAVVAGKIRRRWAFYTPAEKRWITEWERIKNDPGLAARRRVLCRYMREQADRIRRAARAERNGWNKKNRQARFESLDSRCD